MKGEGKLHTKAFGRFQDVNGNVDRVENSGLERLSFFLGESSIIIFVYNILRTLYTLYISGKLSIRTPFLSNNLLTLFMVVNKPP